MLPALPLDPLLTPVLERAALCTEEMSELQGRRLVVEPSDLPGALVFTFGAERLTVAFAPVAKDAHAHAHIRGPTARLLELLEGNIDGDALFFARELEIEGEVALVVALRNLIETRELRLESLAASIPPSLRVPASAGCALAARLLGDAAHLLERVDAGPLRPLLAPTRALNILFAAFARACGDVR